MDPEAWAEPIRQCARIMTALAADGIRLAMLDLGGGFPVSIPAASHRTLVACTLTGPSCDSQDTILDRVWLLLPHAGDRVLIGNAGAYTTSYSGRSSFNGYPAPAVRILT